MIQDIWLLSNYKRRQNLQLFIQTEQRTMAGRRLPLKAIQVLTLSAFAATVFKKATHTVVKSATTHTPTPQISIGITLQLIWTENHTLAQCAIKSSTGKIIWLLIWELYMDGDPKEVPHLRAKVLQQCLVDLHQAYKLPKSPKMQLNFHHFLLLSTKLVLWLQF